MYIYLEVDRIKIASEHLEYNAVVTLDEVENNDHIRLYARRDVVLWHSSSKHNWLRARKVRS